MTYRNRSLVNRSEAPPSNLLHLPKRTHRHRIRRLSRSRGRGIPTGHSGRRRCSAVTPTLLLISKKLPRRMLGHHCKCGYSVAIRWLYMASTSTHLLREDDEVRLKVMGKDVELTPLSDARGRSFGGRCDSDRLDLAVAPAGEQGRARRG